VTSRSGFELRALAVGRVVDGDFATVERAPLAKQERIEWKLGADYVNRGEAGEVSPRS
jgi:hypothetical protein